jgi:hypothetical protein
MGRAMPREMKRKRTKALAYILMFAVEKLLLGLMFGVGVVVVDDKSYFRAALTWKIRDF